MHFSAQYGRTPLAQAVINGHLVRSRHFVVSCSTWSRVSRIPVNESVVSQDVASLLLENGANPDGRDYGTETALHAAVHAPHPEVIFFVASEVVPACACVFDSVTLPELLALRPRLVRSGGSTE